MKNYIHRDRPQIILHIAKVENNHLAGKIHIRTVVDETGKYTRSVFFKTRREILRSLHAPKNIVQIGHRRELVA